MIDSESQIEPMQNAYRRTTTANWTSTTARLSQRTARPITATRRAMAPAVAVRKLDINAIGPNQLAVVPALAGIRYPVSGGGATVPHFTPGGYWVPDACRL